MVVPSQAIVVYSKHVHHVPRRKDSRPVGRPIDHPHWGEDAFYYKTILKLLKLWDKR